MTTFRERLKAGTIIIYVLCPHHCPRHPEKEWYGQIQQVYLTVDDVEVEVLNEGYQGERERVSFKQIISIECES